MKLAAIDLGSNSFRLEIARVEGERIITEGSWKETIRLAAGIDKDGNLTPEAQNRGLNALARIAEKIRGMPRNHIRAVGTQSLEPQKTHKSSLSAQKRFLTVRLKSFEAKKKRDLYSKAAALRFRPRTKPD